MSNNIFEPLVDVLLDAGKMTYNLLYKCITKNKKRKNHQEFTELFKNIGLSNKSNEYPGLLQYNKEKYFDVYLFKCPIGVTLENFEKVTEKLAHFLGVYENSIRLERKNYDIAIKVMTNRPDSIYEPEEMKRKDFKIPLGYDLSNNKMVYWNMIDSSSTHCYIAGSSGGGKSVMLRLILSHLVNSLSKRDIEFSIVNTKRVDLKDFKAAKHTKHYMTGIEGVEQFLEREVEEMEIRYKLLEKNDCDDLKEFRQKHYKIPYRLIVVEEISSYKGNKDYQRSMELLASQGRGAGMLLLLVTQLPSHEIMPNTIKCNINTTIGLRTKDQIRAEIIAGSDSGLEKLKGNGHAKLFDGKHDGSEFQGLNITKEMMKEIINKNKRAEVAVTTSTLDDNKISC